MSSNTQSSPAALAIQAHPDRYQGPWLLGSLFSMFLQGILLVQIDSYFRTYRKDALHTRSLKSAQTAAVAWNLNVEKFGDYDALAVGSWYQMTTSLSSGIISFAVQGYFTLRLAKLTNRNIFLLTPLALLTLFGLSGAIAMTVITMNMGSSAGNVAKFNDLVSINAGSVLVLYLLIRSKTGYKATDRLVNKIVHVTWMSALPPFICALLNLVTYLTMSKYNTWFITRTNWREDVVPGTDQSRGITGTLEALSFAVPSTMNIQDSKHTIQTTSDSH
ncbi:hypothetical protein PUNSTDRAFT_44994 [Punctularia strigosozonata HHB-11173 SS5]|uniref:uncharacterized protein n=1 Tax=Punctularia strigosozonata (strain HHB-11173) TaxID=741275 RepID=UPI000441691E|nr:uncharacterized protein PUNSTDRAFT_44994 [Punctularia strigosozonata HHB-11173 SS5]EIN08505.1 hypothetical protein PUNSTDRAFT_44994 [Punctularia strigosozonata HHB-11173 SS5]